MKKLIGLIPTTFLLLCEVFPSLTHAQPKGFGESVRVSYKLLDKRIPGSRFAKVSDVLKVLYPKVVAVHDDHPGDGFLVVDVQTIKGHFVSIGDEGTGLGPDAIAVLVIEETSIEDDGNNIELIPKLAFVTSNYGRLKLLASAELTDFKVTIDPEHDGGSGLKLSSWDVHPSAKAIVVTVLRSQTGPDMNNATAELCLYFISGKGELTEVYQTDVLDQTDETTAQMSYSEQMRVKTTVDPSGLFNGLRVLNVENYSSRKENGRLKHVEIDYHRLCWDGNSYENDCNDVDELNHPLSNIRMPVLHNTPGSQIKFMPR